MATPSGNFVASDEQIAMLPSHKGNNCIITSIKQNVTRRQFKRLFFPLYVCLSVRRVYVEADIFCLLSLCVWFIYLLCMMVCGLIRLSVCQQELQGSFEMSSK